MRSACLALLPMVLVQAQTPAVTPGRIVNSGSYIGAGVAPGSLVSIYGANLASQPVTAAFTPLPSTLGNVMSVTFDGIPAPLYSVAAGQVNAQVPWNVASGAVDVVVTTDGGSSAAQSVQIVPAMPGIFTASADGIGPAIVANNTDGSLTIWCTGLGAVDTPVADGATAGDAIVNSLAVPAVLIGGVPANVVSSVLSADYVGEYEVTVQPAAGTPTGAVVPLQIQVNRVTTLSNVTIPVAGSGPAFQTLHAPCTLTSTGCVQINLAATDPFSTAGPFGGYADATVRQDPLTGTLWMAYSWPHTIPSGTPGVAGSQVLDTHLAYSTDGGKTWIYKGVLYKSQPSANPVTGKTDYTAHEVMNLLPQVLNGVTWWYGIHSTYNVPQASGGGSGAENYSKRWEMALAPGTAADGPMGLASATPQFLGKAGSTYPQYFPISVNLSSLDAEVRGCTQFFEPALVMANNNLYLFLACTPANPANRFYAVFKTSDPQDNAPNWMWTYVPQGSTKFATQADAVSIGRYLSPGATYVTQMDIAPSQNPGILLAIATAAYDTAAGKISLGCVAAELTSIDPPKFAYDAQGQVQVDTFLTSPDSQDGGPGSCTYSPASATGMVLAHRQSSKAPQNGGFFIFLMQSLLFP